MYVFREFVSCVVVPFCYLVFCLASSVCLSLGLVLFSYVVSSLFSFISSLGRSLFLEFRLYMV